MSKPQKGAHYSCPASLTVLSQAEGLPEPQVKALLSSITFRVSFKAKQTVPCECSWSTTDRQFEDAEMCWDAPPQQPSLSSAPPAPAHHMQTFHPSSLLTSAPARYLRVQQRAALGRRRKHMVGGFCCVQKDWDLL